MRQAGGGGKESTLMRTARAEKYLAGVSRRPWARSMNGYTSNHLKGKLPFFLLAHNETEDKRCINKTGRFCSTE